MNQPIDRKQRLEIECEKLHPEEERVLADLGLAADAKDWPEYDEHSGEHPERGSNS